MYLFMMLLHAPSFDSCPKANDTDDATCIYLHEVECIGNDASVHHEDIRVRSKTPLLRTHFANPTKQQRPYTPATHMLPMLWGDAWCWVWMWPRI